MREKAWEYVGRTVDEATETALEELGLERDDIYVEILEEPQKGFLGLGGKEARIRVELIGEWEVLAKAKEEPPKSVEEVEVGSEDKTAGVVAEEELIDNTAKPVKMVNDILEIFGIDAVVEAKDRQDSIVVDVWGEDVAVLIGKGGSTLDAMQYLVNICCRRTGSIGKRIIVDIEGYRKRRKARLEKEAEQLARRVIQQKKSMELPPMTPSERKTVHLFLGNISGVRTESEGEGPDRRVVIYPVEDRFT
jgi:spoIIIJ-associated protein